MNRSVVMTVMLALAAGGLGLLAGRAISPRPSALPVSASAPESASLIGTLAANVSLPDLDGRQRTLDEWRGRPLLLNFWASWCGPCIEEMPLLDSYAAEQGDDGVQVVGIALDEREAVLGFLAATPVSYPILIDATGANDSSVRLGNVRAVLPYSVLIDAQGRLLAQKLGLFEPEELPRWVDAAR